MLELSKPHVEHKKHHVSGVRFGIITVSSSRWKAYSNGEKVSDPSGDYCEEIVKKSDHVVVGRELVPDNREMIREAIKKMINVGADIIITIGGTGITRDDVTIETVEAMMNKKLPGFGELFRYLSYKEIGSSAFLSRATAGVIDRAAIFSLPGSINAVKLAMEKLIINEAGHIKYMLERE